MGMNDEYGKKMSVALAAVRRMHKDVSKLLVDADRTIGQGKKSIFEKAATSGLSKKFDTPNWMARFSYRYYYSAAEKTDSVLVDAITVWFFDEDDPTRIEAPHLLI